MAQHRPTYLQRSNKNNIKPCVRHRLVSYRTSLNPRGCVLYANLPRGLNRGIQGNHPQASSPLQARGWLFRCCG